MSAAKTKAGAPTKERPKRSRSSKPASVRKDVAPTHDTPPTDIPPPSTHRQTNLPLLAIGSVRFEELCRILVRRKFEHVASTALKRVSGTRQFGVDVEGHGADHEPDVVVQAKCYANVKPKYLRPWVKVFTDELDKHWSGRKINHFVLAITHPGNEDELNNEWRQIVVELRALGIQGHLWHASDISDELRKDASLVDQFFNRYWVDAVSAATVDKTPPVQARHSAGSAIGQAALANMQALAALIPVVDASARARLDAAIAELRGGRERPIADFMVEYRSSPDAWDAVDPSVRARILRVNASLLIRRDDIVGARALLAEADTLAPATDAISSALLARAEGTIQDGLAILAQPRTVKEREVRAAWLLEIGDVPGALAALEAVTGDDVTAEVLRLRAIGLFRQGRRETALRTAVSAYAKAPHDALPRLTLGSMRVMAALAVGSEAQFGPAPNPVNPGLVREGREARALLEDAARDFEHLVATVDSPLKNDIEVWRLASLLLHPGRRAEARVFGRQLLRRTEPEPVAIAWSMQFDLRFSEQKVRHTYSDMVQAGRANPSHLVVLAMLTARKRGASAGLEVINRYADRFPEDREFLDAWRANFGDADAPGAAHPKFIQRAVREKNNVPLMAFLMSADASADEVLAGAVFLAQTRAWPDLDQMRSRLAGLGTEVAIGLAANAALQNGKPEEAIKIIGDGAACFDEGRLPSRLLHLRIKASESLGLHRPIIEDLSTLLSGSDDPQLRRRLALEYMKIGDLGRARNEFKLILQGNADKRDLLAIADALRGFDPDVARLAVSQVSASEGELSPELASAMMGLASELGLSALQDRLMPLIVADAQRPGSLVKSLTVEEVIAFVQERAAEHRARIDAWLRGERPVAAAMVTDKTAFARMFLAAPEQRVAHDGNVLPMLVRSGAWDRPALLDVSTRRELRLDLGALLLSHRLGLLAELDHAFMVVIPPSLPAALMELENSFHAVNRALLESCRTALDRATLKVVDAARSESVCLYDDEDMSKFRPGRLALAARLAFEEGHLSHEQLDVALREDEGSDDYEATDLPALLVVNASTMFHLSRLGLLEPLARAFDLQITKEEADLARGQMDRAESDGRIKEELTSIREEVARRRADDRWRNIATGNGSMKEGREAELPSHLRCLMEVLTNASPDTLIWTEDRTVSAGMGKTMPDVVSIMQALRSTGAITADRELQCLKRLRDMGYAFLPVEHGIILADIEAATSEEDDLLETSELAAWRVWFARDVEHLRHIDISNVGHAVAGEVRRALFLGNVARHLLGEIWKAADVHLDMKAARSNWVWRSLRFLTAPIASTDPEAVKHHAALGLAHVLDLPFMSLFDGEAFSPSDQQAFVNWLLHHVLDPAARADKELAELIGKILGSLFARSIDTNSMLDVPKRDRRSLQAAFKGRINDFLNLLPDAWSDRIVGHDNLREQLGRVSRIVLKVSGRTSIPAAEIARAYAEGLDAARQGVSTIVPLIDAEANPLTLIVEPAIDAEPRATIQEGDRRMQVDALTLALSHPDPDTRAAKIVELRQLVDTQGAARPADWEDVVRTAEVEPRFWAARSLMENDFHGKLVRLKGDLDAGRSITIKELSLPEPASLARYLDLEIADEGAPGALAAVGAALIGRIGATAAAGRLAGLPIVLLPETKEALGAAVTADEGDWQRWLATPLLALLRIEQMSEEARASEPASALLTGLVDLLENGAANLFVGIVRNGGRQASVSPTWVGLDPTTRICLLWVWANALTQVFATTNDLPGLAKFVSQQTQVEISDHLAEGQLPAWERMLGQGLNASRFKAGVATRLLSLEGASPSSALADRLKAMLGPTIDGVWEPYDNLLFPPPPAPSDVWAAVDPIPVMTKAGWIGADDWFQKRDPDEFVAAMADSSGSAPAYFLPARFSSVAIGELSSPTIARMRDLILQMDGERHADPAWNAAAMIMLATAAVWGRLGDIDGFRQRLRRQAERCAGQWPRRGRRIADRAIQDAVATSLVDVAFRHARELSNPLREQMAIFGETVEVIAAAWPGPLAAYIELLDTVARQSRTEDGSALWPSLMRLRALSG